MYRGLLLIMLLSIFAACNNKNSDLPDSESVLYADQINSHTAGVISVTSPVRIRLSGQLRDTIPLPPDIIQLVPAVKGTVSWEDRQTIVFTPDKNLPAGTEFHVRMNLIPLFGPSEEGRDEFRFSFRTLTQNFDVRTRGLALYSADDLTRMKLQGTLITADHTGQEAAASVVTAFQNGNKLTISWSPGANELERAFTVENIQRTESESLVTLQTDGNPIDVDRNEDIEITVPALGDYKVISAVLMANEERYISVRFSDPLDPDQNLDGLVTTGNAGILPRLVVQLNELRVYPSGELEQEIELTIHKGIRNAAGYPLKEPYTTTIPLEHVKPEVRLADNRQGTILPNARERVLPFEAAGLNAVDVTVVRIYPDNMLQYLQVNSLGDNNELRRVGRPLVRKTIPLNTVGVTNLNSWNRYMLDLHDIFDAEPGALYQVTIGFRKDFSTYQCPGEKADSMEEIAAYTGENADEPEWDEYEYYYSPDYDWSERDNPCSNSYYGDRRSVSKVVMSSNLGLIAKRAEEGDLHVFVTDILSAEPQNNVKLELYDYQQQLLATGTTDGRGSASFTAAHQPFILVARKGKDTGYLKLDGGSALSMSNFDVSGERIRKGLKGFIYGERGVWRPADTVHLALMIEDKLNNLPENHPVIMEFFNPAGQLAERKVTTDGIGGIYRFDFITGRDAPTGNWRATAKVGGTSFSKTVRIETIKPNRLRIDVDFESEKFTADDGKIAASLDVQWLSGATASDLDVTYDMLLTPVRTTFKAFPDYSFDDPSRDFNSSREQVFEGKVDGDGNGRIEIPLDGIRNAPGKLRANLYGKVYEKGGDFSISNSSVEYLPYTHFVGVHVPEGDRRGMLVTDTDHTVDIATVDENGNPVSRENVLVELYKVSWRWWWDNSYDNVSNYVGRSNQTPVLSGKINTVNGKGTWKMRINQPDWGRYFLRVTDPASGHSAGQVVYIDWPGWAGKGRRGELDGASMLDFSLAEDEYNVGDEITVTIPSTTGNKILVSLESGSRVIRTFWADTKPDKTEITFDATPGMAPNLYVHLTMIQPHEQTTNDLPIRLYGVKSVSVTDPSTVLEPVIRMPESLKPEEPFTVSITEASGRPMAYTIAVVDEGLLDITNFTTPDPWNSFYHREALGVRTWDVFDDVMGAFGGSLERLLAIGGDNELAAMEEKEMSRFKPVVKFLGPFYLEKGKKNSHRITLPQYIGSVKTMVVAAKDAAYGHAEKVTPVKLPVMVLGTLPRVAGPGERMKLPVNVFAMEENIGEITVTIETEGRLQLEGASSKSIRMQRKGDEIIYFDLKASESSGPAKVSLRADAAGNKASYDIEMNVSPRNPPVTLINESIIEGGSSWDVSYSPAGIPGSNSGVIELSTLPPLNLEKRIEYLIAYPHGCVEQTVSAVFAQLYLDRLTNLTNDRKEEIQRNIDDAIRRLNAFQTADGGFAYWPGQQYANNWGTNYAGHFLLEAKSRGYYVPENMISEFTRYQHAQANAWGSSASDQNNDLIQAYRLYTLALAGSPALGAMNRLKESGRIGQTAEWRLALAYVQAGFREIGRKMVEGLSVAPQSGGNQYAETFGSGLRDQAMILEALLLTGNRNTSFQVLRTIAGEMGETGKWMSTQTTAYCLLAISKYAGTYDLESPVSAEILRSGQSTKISSRVFLAQHHVKSPDTQDKLSITNTGNSPLFARLIRTGIPIEGSESMESRNIKLEIRYTDMNGNTINPNNLKQGVNFKAEVTVSNPGIRGNQANLALTQIFPSGWEIINTRLDGSGQGGGAEYTDIRDDRVMQYFDLDAGRKVTFEVLLNATYIGTFYKPAVTVEAMYDNTVFASVPGEWIRITE